jgi:RimJ/RimL family protein N-acetyltransferase
MRVFDPRVSIAILRSGPCLVPTLRPEGCGLLRANETNAAVWKDLVESAMVAAREPPGLSSGRFQHGDECFAWERDGRLVSFGWVTYRDRHVGPVCLADRPRRAFLFNFHTLPEYRGRGLYPALLFAIRYTLGTENITEFIIDVNTRNIASMRGIEKGGFQHAGEVAYAAIGNRVGFIRRKLDGSAEWPPLESVR